MAKGYWLIGVDIDDAEQFQRYGLAAAAVLKDYGGRFLVRGGPFERVEGQGSRRHSVIEFPSYQQALDCWHSPDYQAALSLRQQIASMNLTIIDGYSGPQPE